MKSSEKKSILPTCSLCNLAVSGVFQNFDIGLTNEDIVDNIALTCISLNLYDEEICRGVATAAIVRGLFFRNLLAFTDFPFFAAHNKVHPQQFPS